MHNLAQNWLNKYGGVLVSNNELSVELADFSSSHDKLASLVRKGELIRLKQGAYCVAPEVSGIEIDKFVIANRLYGPSYVSFESALAHYGLIPERVVETMSAVDCRGKRYQTPIGRFSYITIPQEVFAVGITSACGAVCSRLIANRTKALCDLLYARRHLRIVSAKGLRTFLTDDLRLDIDEFGDFDASVIDAFVHSGRKCAIFESLKEMVQ